ncbi:MULTISPECIES: VWA domain-containing protein [unclassified Paenibacillus]|uniref:vWA domain-containing protein n=1 Tax=unclassified Paenibacillus TaxID=185978 RepID=UPI00093073D4|nr:MULTISPECIES: vWA domain-containing protein [unclassified Paenibacillus]
MLPLLLALLPLQAVAATAASPAGDARMDAVLSVDVSTSMNESDVNKVSFEAVKLFVDMASVQGDKIGVVAYTDRIMREKALLEMKSAADKQSLKGFIDQLDRGPYTDLAVGVSEAVKVLENGADPAHTPVVVLLTDGNNSLPAGRTQEQSDKELAAAVERAKAKGIPVYTIGLNADGQLNKAVLDKIAADTGAKSFVTSSADDLPGILSEIYARHLNLKVVPVQDLTANGAYQEVTIDIPNASVREANISLISGSPVEVKLADPQGKAVAIPSDKVVYTSSKAYTLLKIVQPAQGTWKLQVKGLPKDKIKISLVYNYDLKLQMEPLPSKTWKRGEDVAVKAYLESGGQKAADAELYKNLKATLVVKDIQSGKSEEIPLTAGAQGISGSYKLPEAHEYELVVKAEDAGYVRETEPVKLSALSGAPAQPTSPAPAEGGEAAEKGLGAGRWAAVGAGVLVLAAAALYALSQWRKANKGFVGQVVIEVRDEDTGERTSPQYRKLNTFKGKVTLHQLLQLAPEFAETKDIVFRPAPGDNLLLQNGTACVIEKGGRVLEAAQGKELRAGDRIRIMLGGVHRSVTLEYIK